MTDPCCTQLDDLLRGILGYVWGTTGEEGALVDCLSSPPCGGEFARYVSLGAPPIRRGDQHVLAVYAGNPALAIEGTTSKVQLLVPRVRVNFGVELWTGCYPVPDAPDEPPSVATYDAANALHHSQGLALYNRLVTAVAANRAGRPDVLGLCTNLTFAGLELVGPNGPTVGWRVSGAALLL